MKKTAILFPGQGAQYAGMGSDFYRHFIPAREVFDEAASVMGSSFIEMIFNGPEEKLQQTEYTQPSILTVSYAIFKVLESYGLKPAGLAGLSLGEFSALVAAGTLSFREALPLVQKRGLFMQEAVPAGRGTMVAIMGIEHEEVESICMSASEDGLVVPANYNCPGQTVISGDVNAVNRAVESARKAGAKRITGLKVSAPFHSPLLKPVEEKLAAELELLNIKSPTIPVVFNVSAGYSRDPEEIKINLVRQVSSPILWEHSVNTMIDSGVKRFIGVGPGTSLSRLMKRIAPEMETYAVETIEDVDKLFKTVSV